MPVMCPNPPFRPHKVERYLGAFWAKGPAALGDWAKVLEKIERGEKKLARQTEISEALSKKIERWVQGRKYDRQGVQRWRRARSQRAAGRDHWLSFLDHLSHIFFSLSPSKGASGTATPSRRSR